jgi:hypothetical protein
MSCKLKWLRGATAQLLVCPGRAPKHCEQRTWLYCVYHTPATGVRVLLNFKVGVQITFTI